MSIKKPVKVMLDDEIVVVGDTCSIIDINAATLTKLFESVDMQNNGCAHCKGKYKWLLMK